MPLNFEETAIETKRNLGGLLSISNNIIHICDDPMLPSLIWFIEPTPTVPETSNVKKLEHLEHMRQLEQIIFKEILAKFIDTLKQSFTKLQHEKLITSLKSQELDRYLHKLNSTMEVMVECQSVNQIELYSISLIQTINNIGRCVRDIRFTMRERWRFIEKGKPAVKSKIRSIDDELKRSINSIDDIMTHSVQFISTLLNLQLLIVELKLSCSYNTMEQQYQRWLYYLYLLLIILVWSGGGKRNYESLSLVIFLSFLLIISGRIELNPGPTLVGEILKLVLRENCHLLSEAIQTCLPDIAMELYAKGFITKCTRNSQHSCAMIDEFEIKLDYTKDVVELEKHCQSFLDCLSSQSGPPLDFSRKLAREWTERVHQELNITLSFETVKDGIISQTPSCSKCTCVQTEQVTTSKQVESGHVPFEITLLPDEEVEIIRNLLDLHRRFVKILRELKDKLTQAVSQGMIKLPDIIDCIENDTENDLSSCVTIDDLIRNIKDSFDFLDCTILLEISQELPDLVEKFENHSKEVENFQNSPPVRRLKEKIQLLYKPYFFCNPNSVIPKTIIYLSKSPGTIVTNRLHTLIKHFFPLNNHQMISQSVKFCVSSVITKTLVPASITAKGEFLSALPDQSLMLADHMMRSLRMMDNASAPNGPQASTPLSSTHLPPHAV